MKSLLLPCAGSASIGVLKMWLLGKMPQPATVGESPGVAGLPDCPLPALAPPFELELPPCAVADPPRASEPALFPVVPAFAAGEPPDPSVFDELSLPPQPLLSSNSDNTPAALPNTPKRIP